MSEPVTVEVIRQVPMVLLVVVLAVVGYHYRERIGGFLASRSRVRVGGLGISLELDGPQLQQEIRAVRPAATTQPGAGDVVAGRAAALGAGLVRASVLWVDDNIAWNRKERRLMHLLGIAVDTVSSTGEAFEALKGTPPGLPYDVVVSDIARGADKQAGLSMLRQLRIEGVRLPVVFYVGTDQSGLGVPEEAYGITNRPDELLSLVLDVLERRPQASQGR